jgi:hypothetical protein
VPIKDWKDVDGEYRLKECHCTPYAIASFAVINKAIRWIGKNKERFTEFVFEEGDAGRKDFEWLVNNIVDRDPERMNSLRPRFDLKALPPLQSADLAVWEQRNFVREKLEGALAAKTYDDLRPSLRRLVERPNDWAVMPRDRIAQWAERHAGVPSVPSLGIGRRGGRFPTGR